MPSRTCLTRLLPLASALVLASSCHGRLPPPSNLRPPANLLKRADEPQITPEALTSEAAFEKWREDQADWGKENAGIIDRACWWMLDAGVKLDCRPR